MPFDFTGLDSSIIAQFWVYFVASWVVGLGLGIIIAKAFFHREKALVAKEKEHYEASAREFEELKVQLEDKTTKLEELEARVAANERYWAASPAKRDDKTPADVALHAAIHTEGD